MIDIRKLKELVRLMVANELTELDLRDSEEQVTLRRGGDGATAGGIQMIPAAIASGAMPPPAVVPDPAASSATMAADEEAGLSRVDSPMVGTFYLAPNPDAAPYVTVGSVVVPETVVCIVEAMKIFNEIKAEVAGTIEKVMVKNGEAVEYGQTLFIVKPH